MGLFMDEYQLGCRLLGFAPEQTLTIITVASLEYSLELFSQEHGRDLIVNCAIAQIVTEALIRINCF